MFDQGILKGEVSLYHWPPVGLVCNQLYDKLTIFVFYLQNRLIQTSQTEGQWYSDTSSFSIPWFDYPENFAINEQSSWRRKTFYDVDTRSQSFWLRKPNSGGNGFRLTSSTWFTERICQRSKRYWRRVSTSTLSLSAERKVQFMEEVIFITFLFIPVLMSLTQRASKWRRSSLRRAVLLTLLSSDVSSLLCETISLSHTNTFIIQAMCYGLFMIVTY